MYDRPTKPTAYTPPIHPSDKTYTLTLTAALTADRLTHSNTNKSGIKMYAYVKEKNNSCNKNSYVMITLRSRTVTCGHTRIPSRFCTTTLNAIESSELAA